jgi:hypothetical protein
MALDGIQELPHLSIHSLIRAGKPGGVAWKIQNKSPARAMTDKELSAIVERKQLERYGRFMRAKSRRVQYEQEHRLRLEEAERVARE